MSTASLMDKLLNVVAEAEFEAADDDFVSTGVAF